MTTIVSLDIPNYDIDSDEYKRWWRRLLHMSRRYDRANEKAQWQMLIRRKRHHRKHRAEMRRKRQGLA